MTEERAIEVALRYREKRYLSPNKKKYGGSPIVFSGICGMCSEIFFTLDNGYLCGRKCQGMARRGERSQWWKGGRRHDSHGYMLVYKRDHPRSSPATHMIAEHTLVMENHLGRYLLPYENVHHRNGIRDDNRLDNLELWCKPQLSGQRVFDLISWVVEKYPAEVRAILECTEASNNVLNGNNHAVSAR